MISGSLLAASFSDTDANSYNTASISPTANSLILAAVTNFKSGTPDTPALSGNGLTWVQIGSPVNYDNAGTQQSLSLFRAMGASPSTGAVTIGYSGVTQLGTSWVISQFSGVDTSGTNGSGAIVQSGTATVPAAGGTTITVNLAAFGSTDNVGFGAFGLSGTGPFTVGSGFTSLGTTANTAPASASMAEWKLNDNSVDATIGASGPQLGAIAVEIKAAVVDTSNIKSVSGVSLANIKSIAGVAKANIKSISGVLN